MRDRYDRHRRKEEYDDAPSQAHLQIVKWVTRKVRTLRRDRKRMLARRAFTNTVADCSMRYSAGGATTGTARSITSKTTPNGSRT